MSGWWSRLHEELAARPFWGTGSTPHVFLRCQKGAGDTAFPGSGEPSLCVVTHALSEPCPLKDPPPAAAGPSCLGLLSGFQGLLCAKPAQSASRSPMPTATPTEADAGPGRRDAGAGLREPLW